MPAKIDAASPGFSQNAPNARISTITVATILVITVNLRRKTVRFCDAGNMSAILVRDKAGQ